jgi:hypothetical protein
MDLIEDGRSHAGFLPEEIKSDERNMSSLRSKRRKTSSMVKIPKKCRVRVLQKDNTVVSVGAGGLDKWNWIVLQMNTISQYLMLSYMVKETDWSRNLELYWGNYQEISKSLSETGSRPSWDKSIEANTSNNSLKLAARKTGQRRWCVASYPPFHPNILVSVVEDTK